MHAVWDVKRGTFLLEIWFTDLLKLFMNTWWYLQAFSTIKQKWTFLTCYYLLTFSYYLQTHVHWLFMLKFMFTFQTTKELKGIKSMPLLQVGECQEKVVKPDRDMTPHTEGKIRPLGSWMWKKLWINLDCLQGNNKLEQFDCCTTAES